MSYSSGGGHGDQLEMDLFPGVPWAGRSPRALTRHRMAFIFKAEAAESHEVPFLDPEQYDLFRSRAATQREGPGWLTGAPSLFPLLLQRGS